MRDRYYKRSMNASMMSPGLMDQEDSKGEAESEEEVDPDVAFEHVVMDFNVQGANVQPTSRMGMIPIKKS